MQCLHSLHCCLIPLRPGQVMDKPQLTQEEYDARSEHVGHLSRDTLETAHKVLVLDKPQSAVAKEMGWSRQRVKGMVNRYISASNLYPAHWQKVTVWLPPADAKAVRKLAEEKKEEAQKQNTK